MTTFTDNGPDYQCPKCGADTSGEIGHECGESPEMEYEIFPHPELPKRGRRVTLEEIKEIEELVEKVYDNDDDAWKAGIKLDGEYPGYIKLLIAEVFLYPKNQTSTK